MLDGIRKTALDWLVYVAARSVTSLLAALPRSAGRRAARLMGDIAYLLDRPSRRAEAMDNLRQAFPSLDGKGAKRMVQGVYRHLAESVLDTVHFVRQAQWQGAEALLECVGFETLAGVPSDTGLIFVTGHFGHWEVLGVASPLIGYPVWTIGRPSRNAFMGRYVKKLRQAIGQRMLDKRGSVRQVMRLLRRGENVAFLIDQDARSHGIFVDFFGRPASTTSSVARISIRTGAPIVFGYARRVDEELRFRITFTDVILPRAAGHDVNGEARRITQRLTRDLEEVIRQAPCEWLWLHRRWKTYPGKYGNS